MKVEKVVEGNKLTVKVSGRLDTTTSPELEQELAGQLEELEELVMDFTELEYISSAGLRVLLAARKTIPDGASMVLSGVNDTVKEILEITGFSGILTVL
jgi:anti-sigma B factor antagonist